MHELSIARSIVELVEEQADNRGASVVEELELEIGHLSGVEIQTLEFALDSAIKGSKLEKARIIRHYIEGEGQCSDCETIFPMNALNTMCGTCGCGEHHHHHDHTHEHSHGHEHHHHPDEGIVINLEQDILQRNNLLAERNRGYFEAKNLFCLNLMSSPGSGKTTLLEETIRRLKAKRPIYVIEGDQQTSNDADRIAALEIPVFQVNTGTGCHLEADMVNHAVKHLNPKEGAILFIENVGNLVCPAMFDLGESKKVVIVSTTEGDDKPLKYPHIFQEADICVINKIDLAPYLNTKVEVLRENALKVNHRLQIFEVSATKGDGMDAWCDWLQTESAKCK